jgi:hypothetical protein
MSSGTPGGLRIRAIPLVTLLLLVLAGVWPVAAAAAGPYTLLVSSAPDRSNPISLAGQSTSGDIYVFASPGSGATRVRFYFDNPAMSGAPRQTESNPPYDFAGGSVSTASPFRTTTVGDGSHTITAAVDLPDGTTQVVHATFTVANSAPALAFSPDSLSLAVDEGGSTTRSVSLASTGGATSFSLSDDAAWLSVSPTGGTTPASLTVAVNAGGLAPGSYSATISATAPGHTADALAVTLSVGGSAAFDQVHLAWVGDPSTTLTVVWRTWDTTTPSQVEYRPLGATSWLGASGGSRASGTAGMLHEVTLSGLSPATGYEYRVRGDGGGWSQVFKTRTAPPRGPADFEAIYVADTGLVGRADGLATGTQQVVNEIAALDPLLVLPGGDYIYYDTDKRYGTLDASIDAWFNQMQPIAARSPLMPTYGNHETLLGESYSAWAARFPTPQGFDGRRNFSFDIGDVHFVSIYAVYNSRGLSSSALQWIEQDILAAKAAGQRWIIPYFHVAPFSDGKNHPSNLPLRQQLGPLFERLGVQIAIASHDQSYERTYPLVDVPATNTPTSTSKSCYTMADGVTWVKVSPGGKLSNISKSFSPFATFPPPPWTAFRDNTMHHFARLVVSAAGSVRLEVYGVVGDDSPPIIQDSFEYTSGTCPSQLQLSAETLALTAAEGGTASQNVILDTSDGSQATYSVSDDAPWLIVSPASGTTPGSLTVVANAAGLAPGTYRATITVTAPGYSSDTLPVSLTVIGPAGAYTLLVSTAPDRASPVPLEGRTVSGDIYVFTSPDSGVLQVRFYLDNPTMSGSPKRTENNAPYDFAGGSVSTASAFRTTTVADGAHTITAAIDLTAGGTQILHATFTVGN